MSRSEETIRIPRLRAVIAALATLVAIGVVVFLHRYRAADWTALALSVLTGAGLCLVVGLTMFQFLFSGKPMSRRDLRGIGLRWGAIMGLCTSGVSLTLLAVRWAVDEQASPVGGYFMQAFLHALGTLGVKMVLGFPAYLAVGAVVGALVGWAIAEAIGVSARREPRGEVSGAEGGEAVRTSRMKV